MQIEWKQSDSAQLREYHQKTHGKLIEYLKGRVPKISSETVEGVALQSMKKSGAEEIIEELEGLLVELSVPRDGSSSPFDSLM